MELASKPCFRTTLFERCNLRDSTVERDTEDITGAGFVDFCEFSLCEDDSDMFDAVKHNLLLTELVTAFSKLLPFVLWREFPSKRDKGTSCFDVSDEQVKSFLCTDSGDTIDNSLAEFPGKEHRGTSI